MSVPKIVDFKNPPLAEVVCGLRFQSLEKFATPHIGLLWQKYQPAYLYYKEQAPILPGPHTGLQTFKIPSFPRIWFTNENESQIIQVQQDRFVTNWRKVEEKQIYPHFGEILNSFESEFSKFTEFLTESELGLPKLVECELSYVNVIPKGQGWNSWSDLSELSAVIGWNWSKQTIFPSPEGLNLSLMSILPDGLGVLQMTVASLKKVPENEEFLQLSFQLKKTGDNLIQDEIHSWFVTAHNWIVKGFLSIINPEVQKEHWKLCQQSHQKKSHSL